MWILALLAATFTGNESCRPCHAAIVDHYATTPMARTSGRVAGGVVPGSFRHKSSGTNYTVDGAGHVRWTTSTQSGERQLEYFIGSGAAGRSYLFSDDGFLFQAPLTWYAQHRRWDASPGYEHDRGTRWSRPVEPNCLFCHASQSRAIYGTQNRYADPPFAQAGVACERCHGPGSEHIAGRAAMVNPAKLQPQIRDSVCSQCHLSGAARIEKSGKRIAAFRPGEDLNDYVAYFVSANTDGGAVRATSHVEKLEASACKKASGDKLWCGTCHNPHQRTASYDARCASCHATASCSRGPSCVSCHMPKARAVDGGHGVLTDHAIPRLASREQPVDHSRVLTPFRGFTATAREFGLAYAEIGDQQQASRLLRTIPADAAISVALGQWQRALALDPNNVVALVNLGAHYAASGNVLEAERLWRAALQRNPAQTAAGTNLITLLEATGRRQDARVIREQIERFEPRHAR